MSNRYASHSPASDSQSPIPRHIQQHFQQQQQQQQLQDQQGQAQKQKSDHFISLLKKITLTPFESNSGSAASVQEYDNQNKNNNNTFSMSNSQLHCQAVTYQSQWDVVPTEFPLNVSQTTTPIRQGLLRQSPANAYNSNSGNPQQTSGQKIYHQMSPSVIPKTPLHSTILNSDAFPPQQSSAQSDYIEFVYPLQQQRNLHMLPAQMQSASPQNRPPIEQEQQQQKLQRQSQSPRTNMASRTPEKKENEQQNSFLITSGAIPQSNSQKKLNYYTTKIPQHQIGHPASMLNRKLSSENCCNISNTIVYLPQKDLQSDSKSIANSESKSPLLLLPPTNTPTTVAVPFSDPNFQPIMPFPITSPMNVFIAPPPPPSVHVSTTIITPANTLGYFQPSAILHKTPSGNPVRIPVVRNPAMSFVRKLEYPQHTQESQQQQQQQQKHQPTAFDLLPDSISINELSAVKGGASGGGGFANAAGTRIEGQFQMNELINQGNLNNSNCSSVVQLEALEIRIEDQSLAEKQFHRQQTRQVPPIQGEDTSTLVFSSTSLRNNHTNNGMNTQNTFTIRNNDAEGNGLVSPTNYQTTHTPHLGDRSHLQDVLNGDEEVSGGYFEESSVWNNNNNSSSEDLQSHHSLGQTNKHKQPTRQQLLIYKHQQPEHSLKVSRQSAKEGLKNQSVVGDSAASSQTSPSKHSATFVGTVDELDLEGQFTINRNQQQQQQPQQQQQQQDQRVREVAATCKENNWVQKNSQGNHLAHAQKPHGSHHNTSLSFSSSPPNGNASLSHNPAQNIQNQFLQQQQYLNIVSPVPFETNEVQQYVEQKEQFAVENELQIQQQHLNDVSQNNENHLMDNRQQNESVPTKQSNRIKQSTAKPFMVIQQNDNNSNGLNISNSTGGSLQQSSHKSSVAPRTASNNNQFSKKSREINSQNKDVLLKNSKNGRIIESNINNKSNSSYHQDQSVQRRRVSESSNGVIHEGGDECSSDRRLQERLEEIRREKEQIKRDLKSIEVVSKQRNPKKVTPFLFNSKPPAHIL